MKSQEGYSKWSLLDTEMEVVNLWLKNAHNSRANSQKDIQQIIRMIKNSNPRFAIFLIWLYDSIEEAAINMIYYIWVCRPLWKLKIWGGEDSWNVTLCKVLNSALQKDIVKPQKA